MVLWIKEGCSHAEHKAVTSYREPVAGRDVHSRRFSGGQLRWDVLLRYMVYVLLIIVGWLAVYGGYCLVRAALNKFGS